MQYLVDVANPLGRTGQTVELDPADERTKRAVARGWLRELVDTSGDEAPAEQAPEVTSVPDFGVGKYEPDAGDDEPDNTDDE